MKPNKRIAVLASAAVAASGMAALTLSSAAEASSQNFTVTSQIAPSYQGAAVPIGSRNFNLTVTPASAQGNTAIEVELTSSDLSSESGPAADLFAGSTEQAAVVAINGVDYTLRGSAIGQNIPKYDGSDDAHGANVAPTMFDPGWVISSTPGGSSSTSTIDGAATWTFDNGTAAIPGDDVPGQAPGTAAGSGGLGASIRGAEGTPVSLVAPATAGTYPITLKAVVVNGTTGTGTVGLTDTFDQVINTAVQTNTGPGASNNGPKNTFNNNVASSYFTFTTPVNVVSTGVPAADASITLAQNGASTIPASTPQTYRAGDDITISSGSNNMWTPSTNWLATVCTDAAGTTCAPNFVIPSLWQGTTGAFDEGSPNTLPGPPTGGTYVAATGAPTNASGQITPTVLHVAGFATYSGLSYLKVFQTTVNVKIIPVNLLAAARTASGPSELSLSAPATVTGTNFYPGETVTIDDNGTGSSTPTTALVDSSGNFSGSFTPTDGTATAFVVSGIGGSATSAAFTISGDNCIAYVGNINTGGGCATSQNIEAEVTAGNLSQQAVQTGSLTLNPDATTIGFGSTPVSATDTPLAGTLNSVTVTDLRGGVYPWSLTAVLNNSFSLVSGANSIAGSEITTVAPGCTAGANSATSGITTAPAGTDFGASVLLCAKDGSTTGNPGDTNGGIFTAASGLSLNVPAFQAAGVYTGTLTITLA